MCSKEQGYYQTNPAIKVTRYPPKVMQWLESSEWEQGTKWIEPGYPNPVHLILALIAVYRWADINDPVTGKFFNKQSFKNIADDMFDMEFSIEVGVIGENIDEFSRLLCKHIGCAVYVDPEEGLVRISYAIAIPNFLEVVEEMLEGGEYET